MICAELNHNPYLLTTEVKFNGQSPHVNSQIEKYQKCTLKDWVNKIPSIFYDEMNGFDFDLLFWGTLADFDEVKRAFANVGVSETDVRLIHQNELEDADAKSSEIDALLTWLQETPNRKFDYQEFRSEYANLFDTAYPYVLIRLQGQLPEGAQISIESVENVDELKTTVLTHTPILFYFDVINIGQSREDLSQLLCRTDIHEDQLFFIIDDSLNQAQTYRIISDLGVTNPQIVKKIDDECIYSYFRNYPITDYIRNTIRVLEEKVGELSKLLNFENENSKLQNADIYMQINMISDNIARLKMSATRFLDKDKFNMPHSFKERRTVFENQIKNWRNKKTKIVGEREATAAAKDFEIELMRNFSSCLSDIRQQYDNVGQQIRTQFKQYYEDAKVDLMFSPIEISPPSIRKPSFPSLVGSLTALMEEHFEEPKVDIFNIFKSVSEAEKQPVRVVTYYYNEWRAKATEVLVPIIKDYILELAENLSSYYDNLADAYHVHLVELISKQTKEKDQVTAQLSEDEQKLQEDNNWLEQFREQLTHIERG